jgi:pyrimidine-nucleoside phosphorylase
MPFHMVEFIEKKRDGGEHSEEEIRQFVRGFTDGTIPDYQAAAWAMAVYFRGMTPVETQHLTLEMARSGEMLDLHDVAPFIVDKHSSGGVGDKVTVTLGPVVASLGLPVGKMSGRALAHTGGTLDKLESIPGFNVNLTIEQFKEQLKTVGLVIAGQTHDLAPADGKLYALRDVTGTVPSVPLIASSIMSKKIAGGADAIVLDVKVGSGAFMKTVPEARELAKLMVEIGAGLDRKMAAFITDMSQPLGNAVGNALEVKEAIDALHGGGPADFREIVVALAGEMLLLAGKVSTRDEARSLVERQLDNGEAWEKFVEFVKAQNGDVRSVENPDLLPTARIREPLKAPVSGYISRLDALTVGKSELILGGAREKKGEPIDHAVGVVLHKKVGDWVEKGEPLMTIHANSRERLDEARLFLLGAYEFSDEPSQKPPLLHDLVLPEED